MSTRNARHDSTEADRLGQTDSERGREAFATPEKAYDQFTERATATQHGREHGDSEKQLQLAHQSNLNALQIAAQVHSNTYVATMQTLTAMLLASVITSSDNANNGAVAAMAEQMAKIAGATPPVTVGGKR